MRTASANFFLSEMIVPNLYKLVTWYWTGVNCLEYDLFFAIYHMGDWEAILCWWFLSYVNLNFWKKYWASSLKFYKDFFVLGQCFKFGGVNDKFLQNNVIGEYQNNFHFWQPINLNILSTHILGNLWVQFIIMSSLFCHHHIIIKIHHTIYLRRHNGRCNNKKFPIFRHYRVF